MSGTHGIESQGIGAGSQFPKFYELVTAHARVRGTSLAVFIQEIFDYGFFKGFCHIPHVEGYPQHGGGEAGIGGIFYRAASARAATVLGLVSA